MTRPTKPWLHVGLLLLTGLSLWFAGGVFWESGAGGVYALWVIAILGAHEMGHYLACRYYRIPATLPFFLPGPPPLGSFGAVIRIRAPIPSRRALFDVAAAGPIAGFVVTLPALVLGFLQAPASASIEGAAELGEPVAMILVRSIIDRPGDIEANALIGAAWVGLLVTSLNLFPVGQLDGGHIAYALSRRAHRWLARLTLVALGALITYSVVVQRQFPAYLLWFAILLWMRDRHPRLLDETLPLDAVRKAVGLVLIVIFVLAFIAVPIRFP